MLGSTMSAKDSEESPSLDPAARKAADAAELLAELGSGKPVPGGIGPPGARFHDDAIAGRIASAHRAHGFAVGAHIGIGADAPRPGSLCGDLLIAHELAHAAQQSRGPSGATSRELEADADRAAALGVEPRHGSGPRLQLTRCSTSAADIATFRHTLLADLADPVANEAKIVAEIDEWGTADFQEVVKQVSPLQGDEMTRRLLLTDAGRRIVDKARSVLADSSDPKVVVFVKHIDEALAKRAAPNRTYKPEQEAEAARVRAAISAETPERKALYKSVSPPLDLDVKIYQPYAETPGGVFYDPWMAREPPGPAGETDLGWSATAYQGSRYEFRNFGGYIRIGPLAATSNEAIRSTLFHEFQHYRLGRERVKGAASMDPAAAALEKTPSDAQQANEEVEVVGLQIEADVRIGKLEPLEFTAALADMTVALATGRVSVAFRDRAFDRIVAAAEASPAGRKALLAGFALLRSRTRLTSAQIKLLDPLKTRVLSLTAPKPKPPAKKGP